MTLVCHKKMKAATNNKTMIKNKTANKTINKNNSKTNYLTIRPAKKKKNTHLPENIVVPVPA
jgi:hypothetical protein